MSAALNNVTTQDTYAAATTLAAHGSRVVNLQVANAAVYWQVGRSAAPGLEPAYDDPEEFLLPGLHSFDRAADAVRVRSAVAGKPAQVTVTARG